MLLVFLISAGASLLCFVLLVINHAFVNLKMPFDYRYAIRVTLISFAINCLISFSITQLLF